MKKWSLLLLVSLAFGVSGLARDFRDFTNKAGVTIHAELLDLKDGKVKIRAKGHVFEIPVTDLSAEDQTFLTEWDLKRSGNEEALYYSELIFEDDFSGDTFGERWQHYKSASLLKDGVMIGKTIDIKDHPGVEAIRCEGRQDMEVSVKFKFAGPEAERFNVWFDDKDFKGSHAGHITSVTIWPKGCTIADAKTGNMENSIYEKKNAPGGLDEETKKLLATKTVKLELDIEKKKDEWHALLIRTKGNVVTVSVDGDEIGSFESEGNGHPTKSQVSLTTNANDVQYDDFVVRAAPVSATGKKGE